MIKLIGVKPADIERLTQACVHVFDHDGYCYMFVDPTDLSEQPIEFEHTQLVVSVNLNDIIHIPN